jgi:hypothetical protein
MVALPLIVVTDKDKPEGAQQLIAGEGVTLEDSGPLSALRLRVNGSLRSLAGIGETFGYLTLNPEQNSFVGQRIIGENSIQVSEGDGLNTNTSLSVVPMVSRQFTTVTFKNKTFNKINTLNFVTGENLILGLSSDPLTGHITLSVDAAEDFSDAHGVSSFAIESDSLNCSNIVLVDDRTVNTTVDLQLMQSEGYYQNPTLKVDQYGRVEAASDNIPEERISSQPVQKTEELEKKKPLSRFRETLRTILPFRRKQVNNPDTLIVTGTLPVVNITAGHNISVSPDPITNNGIVSLIDSPKRTVTNVIEYLNINLDSDFIACDTAVSEVVLRLPATVPLGQSYTIVDSGGNAGENAVVILTSTGAVLFQINDNNGSATMTWNGIKWLINKSSDVATEETLPDLPPPPASDSAADPEEGPDLLDRIVSLFRKKDPE